MSKTNMIINQSGPQSWSVPVLILNYQSKSPYLFVWMINAADKKEVLPDQKQRNTNTRLKGKDLTTLRQTWLPEHLFWTQN